MLCKALLLMVSLVLPDALISTGPEVTAEFDDEYDTLSYPYSAGISHFIPRIIVIKPQLQPHLHTHSESPSHLLLSRPDMSRPSSAPVEQR